MARSERKRAGPPQPGHVEDIQATELLREDHRKVKELFDEFERTEEPGAKRRLVERALVDLTVHTKLEEELFYPTVRRETGDQGLLDEAQEEHHVAKLLIGELASMKPSDPRYDAKFLVLAESVRRHIEEEEAVMLPGIEGWGFDLETLGQEMTERKLALEREVSVETIRDEAPLELEGVLSSRAGGSRARSSRRIGGRGRARARARAAR